MGTPRFTLNLGKRLSARSPSEAILSLKYLNGSVCRRIAFAYC